MALPLLFALGAGAKATSTLMQGWMADKESRAEQRLAERNAVVAERNATAIILKSQFDQRRAAVAGERTLGRLSARLGASGARTDVGAPMAILADQVNELDLEQSLIFHTAQTQASALRDQATLLRFGGKAARRRGRSARVASLFKASSGAALDYAVGKQLGFFGKGGKGGQTNTPGIIEARD